MTTFFTRRYFLLTLIAFLIVLNTRIASACITRTEDPEELKRQAEVVVQAIVLDVEAPRQTFMSFVYPYQVSIRSVERGKLALESFQFTYEDLMMHRRGKLTVCPLKHGSGIEHALKPKALYRMYLRSASDKEILLAEEIIPEAAPLGGKDLGFVGTVRVIEASPLDQSSLAGWIVTFSVDRVTQGEYSKQTFSIRIHSPARSGLTVGKQYSVKAKWNGTGYDVDEHQWIGFSG